MIRLTVKDTALIIRQLWDGKEIRVEPLTNTYFYNNAQSFPLQIDLDPDGKIRRVTLLENSGFKKVAGPGPSERE